MKVTVVSIFNSTREHTYHFKISSHLEMDLNPKKPRKPGIVNEGECKRITVENSLIPRLKPFMFGGTKQNTETPTLFSSLNLMLFTGIKTG